MTVVFSDMSSATPRTMKRVPSVTMKAGTLSLAMITPLTEADRGRAADRREKPRTAERKSGTPGVEGGADGERREHRGEAHHPADREVDAGGDDDEGLAEAEEQDRGDRDEDVLRVAEREEVDAPPLTIGTATTKKTISSREEHPGPEPAEARMKRCSRCPGRGGLRVESGHAVAFAWNGRSGARLGGALRGCRAAVRWPGTW